MTDILLTARGDLALHSLLDSKDRLEINFATSKSNALQVNFFIEDTFYKDKETDSLLLNFFITNKEENQDVRMISDAHAMEQAIKIRLLSSLGSITGNDSIGSKLETIIHSNIDNGSTKTLLTKIIKEAISDLFNAPTITIKQLKSSYLDYSDGFTVIVSEGNNAYEINL